MEKTYQPKKWEKKIYQMWEKGGYFTPKISQRKPFCIVMPPPNANAPIHVGFGVNVSVEDLMTRYHRMKGESTLWLPGSDHASIATQVSFERKLAQKGLTRYDLGRKKFYKETMKFTLNNKRIMQSQVRALGASCDWSRDSFTLDPKFDGPIYTVFKKLYDNKLIYRDNRLVNWCPRCQTALSDLEVEHKEKSSQLWYLRYPLISTRRVKKSSQPVGFITVATTRPETMLGDTAVAVHPKDKRYQNSIGKKAILPLMNREIPIITDEAVDPKFGTGVVKVTPAHDPVDFELGQKHKLQTIQVIGFDGKMTAQAGQYSGLTITEAREKVLADLKKQGLLEKEQSYTHSIGHCERCKTTIEPLVSLQWFIKIKSLAKPAIEAVKKEKVEIIPARFQKIYFNWMENIRDWCISRQLWWGHQMPVWYCGSGPLSSLQKLMNKIPESKGCGKVIVSIKPPNKCPQCANTKLIRDPDTLDTWFSSGQWPFNTLGWLEDKKDFQYFYPTSVMETGYEILFFWVARMIMLSLYVTGKIPFKVVYLHGMVRDAFGQKMSKSKPETCIDPMETIEEFGADALRMALIMGNAPGTDSSLSKDKIRGMRNFANKVWNASRFALTQINADLERIYTDKKQSLSSHPDDKWILKENKKTVKTVTKHLEKYRFDLAAEKLYHFFWHTFCDQYIEKVKPRLKNNESRPDGASGQITASKASELRDSTLRRSKLPVDKDTREAKATLLYVLETNLKLLHPFMPFVTEVIWQKFPRKYQEPLIISSWPKV